MEFPRQFDRRKSNPLIWLESITAPDNEPPTAMNELLSESEIAMYGVEIDEEQMR